MSGLADHNRVIAITITTGKTVHFNGGPLGCCRSVSQRMADWSSQVLKYLEQNICETMSLNSKCIGLDCEN